MELHDALTQLSEIRAHVARTEPFRGYRSASAAFSAVVAIAAALLQPLIVASPTENPQRYLAVWIVAAAVSVLVTAVEMVVRCRRSRSPTAARMTWLAVEQFLPCTLVGAILSLVLVLFAPDSLWLLPGLWCMLFSLGVFASCRLLPRATVWVAWYYLVCGAALIALARDDWAFSPWAMGSAFGIGQFLSAAVLYVTMERNNGRE